MSPLWWFGPLIRMPPGCLPLEVSQAGLTGRRSQGRTRSHWRDHLSHLAFGFLRRSWKALVAKKRLGWMDGFFYRFYQFCQEISKLLTLMKIQPPVVFAGSCLLFNLLLIWTGLCRTWLWLMKRTCPCSFAVASWRWWQHTSTSWARWLPTLRSASTSARWVIDSFWPRRHRFDGLWLSLVVECSFLTHDVLNFFFFSEYFKSFNTLMMQPYF